MKVAISIIILLAFSSCDCYHYQRDSFEVTKLELEVSKLKAELAKQQYFAKKKPC